MNLVRALLQDQPVIVNIGGAPDKNASGVRELTNVIVGALGLTGAFAVVAVVVGALIGVILFWRRSRG